MPGISNKIGSVWVIWKILKKTTQRITEFHSLLRMVQPMNAPALQKLRAVKFGGSSAQTHVKISALVKDGTTVAFVKVDNGHDWPLISVTNDNLLLQIVKRQWILGLSGS